MAQKYQFITQGLYGKITADRAAAELERIRNKYGTLKPELVVNESRSKRAVLHSIFTWDDAAAAEKWRREQARGLIKNIVVVVNEETVTCTVRAFVNVRPAEGDKRSYTPINEAVLNDVAYKDLLEQSKSEMESFVTKYSQITELNPVKAEMLKAINGIV